MPKHCRCCEGEITEFGKFWADNGYLWVPYVCDDRRFIRRIKPAIAASALVQAAPILASIGNVVPLHMNRLKRDRHS